MHSIRNLSEYRLIKILQAAAMRFDERYANKIKM